MRHHLHHLFLHGGRGLVRHHKTLYNKHHGHHHAHAHAHHGHHGHHQQALDHFLLSKIKNISLYSKASHHRHHKGAGALNKKYYSGGGLKFVR